MMDMIGYENNLSQYSTVVLTVVRVMMAKYGIGNREFGVTVAP